MRRLRVLETGAWEQGAGMVRLWWGLSSSLADGHPLTLSSCVREWASSLWSLLIRTLIPSWRLHPHDLPKTPPSNTITLEVRASNYEAGGGGEATIESTAVDKCVRLKKKKKRKKRPQIPCHCSHQGVGSLSSWLDHVTCFAQWDISKCDTEASWKMLMHVGLALSHSRGLFHHHVNEILHILWFPFVSGFHAANNLLRIGDSNGGEFGFLIWPSRGWVAHGGLHSAG